MVMLVFLLLIMLVVLLLVMLIDDDVKYKVCIFLFNPRIITRDDPRYNAASRIELAGREYENVTILYHELMVFTQKYKLRKNMYIKRGDKLLPLEPCCSVKQKLYNDFLQGKRFSKKELNAMNK